MADSDSLAGKTALITGAAKRLGRTIALALAQQGVHVVVHFRSSASEAQDTAQALRGCGVRAWTVSADLSDSSAASQLVTRAVDQAGPIDFLINNASIFPSDDLLGFSPDAFHSNMEVNALVPLMAARAFAAQDRQGVIVNLLDSRVTDYDRGHVSYHLSKRTLLAITKMLALELAPQIRVNAVAPGLILPPEGQDEQYLEALASTNPLKRHGEAEDIADAVLFLLRGTFITGQVIFVDGGRHLRGSVYGC